VFQFTDIDFTDQRRDVLVVFVTGLGFGEGQSAPGIDGHLSPRGISLMSPPEIHAEDAWPAHGDIIVPR
jgi:hypothetical protein